MSRAKVTSKGQITIPLEVRRSLGVEMGDYIAFEVRADYVVMHRQKSAVEVSRELRERTAGVMRAHVLDDEAIENGILEDVAAEDHGPEPRLVRVNRGQRA